MPMCFNINCTLTKKDKRRIQFDSIERILLVLFFAHAFFIRSTGVLQFPLSEVGAAAGWAPAAPPAFLSDLIFDHRITQSGRAVCSGRGPALPRRRRVESNVDA